MHSQYVRLNEIAKYTDILRSSFLNPQLDLLSEEFGVSPEASVLAMLEIAIALEKQGEVLRAYSAKLFKQHEEIKGQTEYLLVESIFRDTGESSG